MLSSPALDAHLTTVAAADMEKHQQIGRSVVPVQTLTMQNKWE